MLCTVSSLAEHHEMRVPSLSLAIADSNEALVEPDKIASQRTLEAAGFQCELRSYLALPSRGADALTYSLLPSDVG
jgi:hypothetical protein